MIAKYGRTVADFMIVAVIAPDRCPFDPVVKCIVGAPSEHRIFLHVHESLLQLKQFRLKIAILLLYFCVCVR